MKAIVHVTQECETVKEAKAFYTFIKNMMSEMPSTHVNGQVTVKFQPSHPEGTPEEGPKP